jgi:hypothetical protein
MRVLRAAFPMVASALVSACTGPQVSANTGIEEPIVVATGQFISGPSPGFTPTSGEGGTSSVDGGDGNPQITDVSIPNIAIDPGAEGVALSGHATPDAQAVTVRFADLGSGYWVIPVGPPDPTDNELLSWSFNADFARALPPGFHDLVFSAIDSGGVSGAKYDLAVCVDTIVPDNLNACVPKRAPPAAVLSLSWDAPVNLNLVVQDPLGRGVGGPTVAATDDGGVRANSSQANGIVDRDSNANCVIDNIDRQDVVWQTSPPVGTYSVWVDLFSACHQPSVTFSVALWLPEPRPDGGPPQLVQQSPPVAQGELTATQANGGTGPGLYVGSFVLE